MRARQLLALRLLHLRIAQAQVGQGDMATLAAECIEQVAESPAELRQSLQRQEMQQPDERKAKARQHGGSAGPPLEAGKPPSWSGPCPRSSVTPALGAEEGGWLLVGGSAPRGAL